MKDQYRNELDKVVLTAGGKQAMVRRLMQAVPSGKRPRRGIRTALAVAAAAAVLTGAAATARWTGLSVWFKGDTAPVQDYVDSVPRSVSDGNYTLVVEGAVADAGSAYATITITALSDEAKAFLNSDDFISMDTLNVVPLYEGPGGELTVPGAWSGPGLRSLEAPAENTRRFAMEMGDLHDNTSVLSIYCGYMEEDAVIRMPLTQAPSVTVTIGASGEGVLVSRPAEAVGNLSMTVREIRLSAFSCRISGRWFSEHLQPRVLFRLADGTVRTQAQMMTTRQGSINTATGQSYYQYQFREIWNLDDIVSVIVFDMEYPVDGSAPVPVAHDPSLDPFTVTRMDPLSEGRGYSLPVQELTEGLGGTCTVDAATGEMTCTYRNVTIVLSPGNRAAAVDGVRFEMAEPPAVQDGVLAADCHVFEDAWGIDCYVLREEIEQGDGFEMIWHDWYIIP